MRQSVLGTLFGTINKSYSFFVNFLLSEITQKECHAALTRNKSTNKQAKLITCHQQFSFMTWGRIHINKAEGKDSSKAFPNCFIKIASLQACDNSAAQTKGAQKRAHLHCQLSHRKRTSSQKLQFIKTVSYSSFHEGTQEIKTWHKMEENSFV